MPGKSKPRYFLDTDEDGHWYLIPESCKKAWDDWMAQSYDDPKAWAVPSFATQLKGSPSNVTFMEPIDA